MARNQLQLQGQPADECPHIHFKTNVIDRDILTKRQHLNLLCTPRGYRWEVAFIKEEEQRLDCSSDPHGKPRRSYVYNLLADLWSVVTPEMVRKLQEMMVKEFGLSNEEASDFICKRMKEMVHAMRKRGKKVAGIIPDDQPYPLFISQDVQQSEKLGCRSNMSINVKPCIVKSVTNELAKKLAEMAMFMMHGKKGHKQRRMSEVLFNGFCQLSGETFNPAKPLSKFHKLQVFLADKLAMWLAENIVDESFVRAKKRRIEDVAIQRKAVKRVKDYDKKVRERAALARKIEIQKRVAKEREMEAKRKQKEADEKLQESRKKLHEEREKKDAARKKQEEAKKLKEKTEKKDEKKKKKEDNKKDKEAALLISDITAKAEKNSGPKKKEEQKKTKGGAESKPVNSVVKKVDNKPLKK